MLRASEVLADGAQVEFQIQLMTIVDVPAWVAHFMRRAACYHAAQHDE